jgi:hypothetical protein
MGNKKEKRKTNTIWDRVVINLAIFICVVILIYFIVVSYNCVIK